MNKQQYNEEIKTLFLVYHEDGIPFIWTSNKTMSTTFFWHWQ